MTPIFKYPEQDHRGKRAPQQNVSWWRMRSLPPIFLHMNRSSGSDPQSDSESTRSKGRTITSCLHSGAARAVEAGAFTGGLPQRLPTTLSCLTNSSFSFSKYPRGSGGLVPQSVGLHEVQFDVSSPKHHLRNLLGNHDGRRIGVPTDNLGHHTCVHHA